MTPIPGSGGRKRTRAWLTVLGFFGAGVARFLYLRVDRDPRTGKIDVGYHVCEKCDSLDGGIYGKGPRKSLRTDAGGWCVHDWRPISREEFKREAANRFNVDWSQVTAGFWAD